MHVTIPHGRRIQPVAGVVLHRSRRIAAARHPSRMPPQTRIEETVLDLTQSARTLDQALGWLARACGRRLTTADRIGRVLRQRSRVRWRRELLDALDDVASGCHSWLELRYDTGDVLERPCETAAQVAATLARSGWTGTPTPCGPTCQLPP